MHAALRRHATVISALVPIVANDLLAAAAHPGLAQLASRARVAVIAHGHNRCLGAALAGVASIVSAAVLVDAGSVVSLVDAADPFAARVRGACDAVVADLWGGLTGAVVTMVRSGASQPVVARAGRRDVGAAALGIADVGCAQVGVIARHDGASAFAPNADIIAAAGVAIVARGTGGLFVNATRAGRARVDRAGVTIVAGDRWAAAGTGVACIVGSARVAIVTAKPVGAVLAAVQWGARVGGAGVGVVAVDCFARATIGSTGVV